MTRPSPLRCDLPHVHTVHLRQQLGIHPRPGASIGLTFALFPPSPSSSSSSPLSCAQSNINLSPAIMSRFDLFFVILDINDDATDAAIARHIALVHQKGVRSPHTHVWIVSLGAEDVRVGRRLTEPIPASNQLVSGEPCRATTLETPHRLVP